MVTRETLAYAESFTEGIRAGRIKLLAAAIPKPAITERVRCNGCRHFERDTIGDGSGIAAKSPAKEWDRDTRHSGRTPNVSVRTSRRGRTMSKRESVLLIVNLRLRKLRLLRQFRPCSPSRVAIVAGVAVAGLASPPLTCSATPWPE